MHPDQAKRIDLCLMACRDLSIEELERINDDYSLVDLIMGLPFGHPANKQYLSRPVNWGTMIVGETIGQKIMSASPCDPFVPGGGPTEIETTPDDDGDRYYEQSRYLES